VLYKTSLDESELPEGYSLTGGRGGYPRNEGYLTFGSSGLLYRSNKLMYDRNTDTLWHQMWGTPAFGPLVGSGIELERLPVTLTTWEAWYAKHPDTKVMAFDTGFMRDYRVGAAYDDYFASPDTMFPVWRRSQILPTKSWVFTLLIDGQPKAYPLMVLSEELVVNDTLAGQSLVVVREEGGYGARAYARGAHSFALASPDTTTTLLDESGAAWQVSESALTGPEGEVLPRLPGHMAYWFGWYSFFPQTEVYGTDGE
jgi:hypothetical protein